MPPTSQWDPAEFQALLRAFMDRRGLSQNQLAGMLGISQTAVNRWFQPNDKTVGRVTRPNPEALESLADLMRYPVGDLMRICGYPGYWVESQDAKERGRKADPQISSLTALMQDAYDATPDEDRRRIGADAIEALVRSIWNTHPRRRTGRPRSEGHTDTPSTEGSLALSYA